VARRGGLIHGRGAHATGFLVFGWQRARLYLLGRWCAPVMIFLRETASASWNWGFSGAAGVALCASRARTKRVGDAGGAGGYG
jgi:hypothetical protein